MFILFYMMILRPLLLLRCFCCYLVGLEERRSNDNFFDQGRFCNIMLLIDNLWAISSLPSQPVFQLFLDYYYCCCCWKILLVILLYLMAVNLLLLLLLFLLLSWIKRERRSNDIFLIKDVSVIQCCCYEISHLSYISTCCYKI